MKAKLHCLGGNVYYEGLLSELPMKTTWTLANLYFVRTASCSRVKTTYAAVAANTSTLRDLVATARQIENNKVNAQTKPSLAGKLFTNERTTIETKGARDEKTVPIRLVAISTRRSS